jgi:hypothetical protein
MAVPPNRNRLGRIAVDGEGSVVIDGSDKQPPVRQRRGQAGSANKAHQTAGPKRRRGGQKVNIFRNEQPDLSEWKLKNPKVMPENIGAGERLSSPAFDPKQPRGHGH